MKKLASKKNILLLILVVVAVGVAVIAANFISKSMGKNKMPTLPLGYSTDKGVFENDIVLHDSSNGEVVIESLAGNLGGESNTELPTLMKTIANPEKIWETPDAYAGNHTFSGNVQMKDGSMGVISIPAIMSSLFRDFSYRKTFLIV